MLFFSPFKAYRFIARAGYPIVHPITGMKTGDVKALRAEFGITGNEYTFKDPLTGNMTTGAAIYGNYFDTDAAAEQQKWTAEEKECVEIALMAHCQQRPDQIRLVDTPEPVVMAPWPTYDTQGYDEIVQFAPLAGLVREALAYEEVNQQRPALLDKLTELIAAEVDEDGEPVVKAPSNVETPKREKLVAAVGGETRGATGIIV